MKGLRLFFVACLAMLAIGGTHADDAADTARAAVRRGTTNSAAGATSGAVSTRGKATNTSAAQTSANTTTGATTISRGTVSQTAAAVRERNATTSRDSSVGVTSRATTTAATRDATTTQSRGTALRTGGTDTSAATRTGVSSRTAATTGTSRAAVSRTAVKVPTAGTASKNTAAATRTGLARTAISVPGKSNKSGLSRAAVGAKVSRAAMTREDVMNRNYSACKSIYYECMDEFCANKDSQLKRCACSSRIHEFDNVKKQLAAAEEKMLDFSQRLLTVNMDKEDAAALNVATEGELAFQQADKSASKKMLDAIAKKLNTSFDSSTFDTGANALSWSLNMDAAFDNVDSLMGASTTSKSGTDLYAAALPICREMAKEVCSESELDIATTGYQVAIEQDCNTVSKAYQTQVDQAREKVREGGALLDMSRLDIYQTRNSDDILACKKKMLDMLTDTTVCGVGLGKCLDTTGQYIDPSTGAAILTENLYRLSSLITRPTGDETWTSASSNRAFVQYLESKKQYLAPAMENCQDIADTVWDGFLEDALAQIKIAQERKLEDMRQSCTTLTAQCISDTSASLADFDARALTIFGIEADKTVNAMCAEVKTACMALLNESGGGGDEWVSGVTSITNNTTFETIMQTCREIGRACIIQACRSTAGNFGLCMNTDTAVNRKAIMSRDSCWSEVQDCVAAAGEENIKNIMTDRVKLGEVDESTGAFYIFKYNLANDSISTYAGTTVEETDEIYDFCMIECGYDSIQKHYTKLATDACRTCRIAERIWGNCEKAPATELSTSDEHNRIKVPKDKDESTLLYWLAQNTNSEGQDNNCRSTECGIGFYKTPKGCVMTSNISPDCPASDVSCTPFIVGSVRTTSGTTKDEENCCTGKLYDVNGQNICCENGGIFYKDTGYTKPFCMPNPNNLDTDDEGWESMWRNNIKTLDIYYNLFVGETLPFYTWQKQSPLSGTPLPVEQPEEKQKLYLFCDSGNLSFNTSTNTVECNGQFVLVSYGDTDDSGGKISYYNPQYEKEKEKEHDDAVTSRVSTTYANFYADSGVSRSWSPGNGEFCKASDPDAKAQHTFTYSKGSTGAWIWSNGYGDYIYNQNVKGRTISYKYAAGQ